MPQRPGGGRLEIHSIDAATGGPVAPVNIELRHQAIGSEVRRVAGAPANAIVENLPPGNYSVVVTASEYSPETCYVLVEAAATVTAKLHARGDRSLAFIRDVAEILGDRSLAAGLVAVDEEIGFRPAFSSPCAVVVMPAPPSADTKTRTFAPGTVTAVVAQKGDERIRRVADAAQSGDAGKIDRALTEVRNVENQIGQRIEDSRRGQAARRDPRDLPTFGELRYGDKSLVNYVFADGNEPLHSEVFPYNGGHLDPKRFTLVEHTGADANDRLESVVVVTPPRLSDIERAALAILPPDVDNVNVGPAMLAWTPLLVRAAVWVGEAAAAGVVGWAVGKALDWLFGASARAFLPETILQDPQFQAQLSNLPPEASARELLSLRRDLLLRQGRAA